MAREGQMQRSLRRVHLVFRENADRVSVCGKEGDLIQRGTSKISLA